LQQLNPEYFQTFDKLVGILVAHGIAPVFQPVFHGYGWKGRTVAGNVVSATDYARYCRYLVARFGARPAIWLVGGPLAGMEPNWTYTYGRRGLAVPGKLFVLYLPEGGDAAILSREVPRPYRVFDPRTGKVLSEGRLPDTVPAQAKIGPDSEPRVVVFTKEE
jgi:hypothetical protein